MVSEKKLEFNKNKMLRAVDGVETKYTTMPDGNVVPVQYLNGGNSEGVYAGTRYDKKRRVVVDILGCDGCGWRGTRICPHFGDVTCLKPHSNGICSKRTRLGFVLTEEGVIITAKRLMMLKHIIEADAICQYLLEDSLSDKPKHNVMDSLPWKKLIVDTLNNMVKHDEGSRIQVEKKVSPMDVAKLLRDANKGVIDVDPSKQDGFEDDEGGDSFAVVPEDVGR